MNGISLAALLGAATWFGSKLIGDHEESVPSDATAGCGNERAEETDTRDNEFLWPSGPMFQ